MGCLAACFVFLENYGERGHISVGIEQYCWKNNLLDRMIGF